MAVSLVLFPLNARKPIYPFDSLESVSVYIDYCIAQTDALQYKAKMDEDFKSAWDSYLKLCYLSASDFFTSMVEEVGLVSPFKDGCIKDVVAKLEKKLGL